MGRTKKGHRRPILSSVTKLPAARVTVLMLARWRQENFFKYMGEHLGVNRPLGYSYQEADGGQLIPHPDRPRVERELKGTANSWSRCAQSWARRCWLGRAPFTAPPMG